jgi:hypothetical protein
VTPDGRQLYSRPLGLSYFDGTNVVAISQLKNSEGRVLGANQVIYTDAFTGFAADLIYTYTKSGFEQDVVLREQPPTPESLGLNPDTARLQVMTEFFSAPHPSIQSTTLPAQAGVSLTDQSLGFGQMQMVQGRAFMVGKNATDAGALVGKHWVLVQGRQILIEEVPVNAIHEGLAALPLPTVSSGSTKTTFMASKQLALPPQRPVETSTKPMLMAKATVPTQGFVLDYVAVHGLLTNYIFQGDTTYYVSGNTRLNGTNIIEGGAVLKFPASGYGISFVQSAILVSTAGPYHMAVLTSVNDNSVGESIGTGSPTTGTENYLAFTQIATNALNYLRFEYAGVAISLSSGSYNVTINVAPVDNCQFLHCGTAVQLSDSNNNTVLVQKFENVLVSQCGTVMQNLDSIVFGTTGSGVELVGQNITVDQVTNLIATWSNDYKAFQSTLTNSILTAVTNQVYYQDSHNAGNLVYINDCYINSSSSGVYQSAAGGNYYLAPGSPYRNAGTTNIDPALLAQLSQKTTWLPLLLTNQTISINTTFSPQAQRDTDTPDLGYHYDPIDYIVDQCAITNATLTLTNGTAIASYNEAGIKLQDNSVIVSIGSPLYPNWFARYSSVQEQSVSLGGTNNYNGMDVYPSYTSTKPNGTYQFTKFASPAGGGFHLYDYSTASYGSLNVQECEFWGGTNVLGGTNGTTLLLDNNLFARSCIGATGSGSLSFSNNLVWGTASVQLNPASGTVWRAYNNDFDSTTINNSILTNGYNAYLNCSGYLTPTNATDIFSTKAMAYQSSWLGSFYQPTSSALINAGSATADQVGLYHYTVLTNQVKETNSIVDIGYHYVATDAYGNPIDTDGDGIPDYLEDTNGNGIYDAGDLGNWLIGPFNGLSGDNGLQVFTPLK